jgi:photosystem II stability/assembly factor-like uncharacterized protein
VFTSVTGLAVDTDDTRAGLGRYRYVAVGAITGPAAAIAVSRTGREWVTRAIPNGCTAIRGVAMLGSRCMIWGSHSAPDERAWQTSLAVGDPSAIFVSDEAYWDVCTDSVGNLADVVAVAYDGVSEAWALTVTSGSTARYRSRNGGQTWPVGSGFTFVASSVGTGIAWDATRSRYVIVGSKGDTYTFVPTEDGGSTGITQRQTLPTAPTTGTIHLRTGGGTCLAWASLDASGTPLAASLLWRSDDGGETWAVVTLPTAIGATLTDVAYADGVWVATTTAAPYLWRSDDAGATWERVQLPLGEESSWALHRAVYADGAVTATGLTWTVQTARASWLAPDATRVYSPEPGYLADAGYLRGRRITSTAPTDGQALVWDASGGVWTPGSASGTSLPDPTGAPDGQVVTTTGGAYGLAAPAGGPTLSSATPQPLGTATAGVSTDAARADHVHALPTTTYDFSSSTGWTLVDSSTPANGEASITGGVARLQVVSGVTQNWHGGGYAGPSIWRLIADSGVTDPSAFRVRARIAAMTADAGAFIHLAIGDSSPLYAVWIRGNGSVRANNNAAVSDLGSMLAAGTALLDGNDWFEFVVRGARTIFRFGRGTGGAAPTTWTELWNLSAADGLVYRRLYLGLMGAAPSVNVTVDIDDVTVVQLP